MAPSIVEQIAIEQTAEDAFVSRTLPRPMGNKLPIAYGGCVVAYAVHAACRTVAPNFHIYSFLGTFLGPTKIDRKVRCSVIRTRDTRTFATRRVVAFQIQDDGSERTCTECIVDFQVEEAALLTYNVPPSATYGSGPRDTARVASAADLKESAVRDGRITRAQADDHTKNFSMMEEFFEWNACLDTVGGQNVLGIAKQIRTTQDHLPIYDKTTSEWMRMREAVSTEAERAASMAFFMDGALSFLPLYHNHMDFGDAGPASTLDFALRFLVPSIDLRNWHLRERKTISGAVGRTYAEARLWDENGQMVAVTTHTSVLRPPPKASQQAKI